MEKRNIRKQVALKRLESKEKYKQLTGISLDSDYEKSRRLREAEDKEYKKFMFFNGLMEAIDYLKEHEDESK